VSERDAQPKAHALFCACILLALLFGYLRVQQLGVPDRTTWDEDHFVLNARNFLAGKPDWNDHPPLGKLLMALPMHALGDSAFSFRLSAACAGLISIVLGFFAGSGLFRDRRAGALCAALIAIDGPLLVYSRTALLDGVLLMFGLACLTALTRRATIATALAAGALLGCAASIKFSGVALLLPLLVFVAAAPHRLQRKLALLSAAGLAAGAVYYAQYAVGHALSGLGTSPVTR
jgi:dolichyl-phosphate-mannose--protein O-mannosyl transferase